jgi:hypothetical protein
MYLVELKGGPLDEADRGAFPDVPLADVASF